MNRTNIKICGIADSQTLNAICEHHINYVGFIFYDKSIRNVTAKFLLELEGIDFKSSRPVCVFVNPDEEEVYKAISFLIIQSCNFMETNLVIFVNLLAWITGRQFICNLQYL